MNTSRHFVWIRLCPFYDLAKLLLGFSDPSVWPQAQLLGVFFMQRRRHRNLVGYVGV